MSATNKSDLQAVVTLCSEVEMLAQRVRLDVAAVDKHNVDRAKAKPADPIWMEFRQYDTVKTAALKRRSMDLTRALARLRRSS